MNMLYINWTTNLEAFSLLGLTVRWYALLWGIGLVAGYCIVQRLYKQQKIAAEKFEPLFLYCFLGILIGARLGHCLFYEPEYFLGSMKGFAEMFLPVKFAQDSWDWTYRGYAGLASHGGAIGCFIALMLYAKRTGVRRLTVLDNIAIATPVTACCIRLGNLMNSEIIGKQTDVPWAFLFHTREAMVDGQLVPRHPAQLYEAIAYALIFCVLITVYINKVRAQKEVALSQKNDGSAQKDMALSARNNDSAPGCTGSAYPGRVGTGLYFGLCLTLIFLFRFFVEFIKKEQVDFEQGMALDMGQLLSIPFIIIGLLFTLYFSRKK